MATTEDALSGFYLTYPGESRVIHETGWVRSLTIPNVMASLYGPLKYSPFEETIPIRTSFIFLAAKYEIRRTRVRRDLFQTRVGHMGIQEYRLVLEDIESKVAQRYPFSEAERTVLLPLAHAICSGVGYQLDEKGVKGPRSAHGAAEERGESGCYDVRKLLQDRNVNTGSSISPDDLLEPGFLRRIMSRQKLGSWSFVLRPLLRTTARYAFGRMVVKDRDDFDFYGKFFSGESFPRDKEGWQLFAEEYEKLRAS